MFLTPNMKIQYPGFIIHNYTQNYFNEVTIITSPSVESTIVLLLL